MLAKNRDRDSFDTGIKGLPGIPGATCAWPRPPQVNSVAARGRWFVVCIQPQREFDVKHDLLRHGIESYIPLVRTIVRRARGRTAAVLRPMFRGYSLVLDTWDQRRSLITSTIGVNRVLENDGHWAALPDAVVQAIFQQEMTERFALPIERKRIVFNPSQFVRIVEGQFAGFTGRFDRLANTDRIVVLLHLLGGQVKVNLAETQVVAA